jgi:drug/metabolite transporter (DMT)-like permease
MNWFDLNGSSLALLFPLASAMLYVVGALLLRRAADFGVGFWRTTFTANIICAAAFSLLWLAGGEFHWRLLWQPAVVALLFLLGSVLNFVSLDRGDVSLATPILGIKIILVAVFAAVVTGDWGKPTLWLAALLSTAGIGMLSWTRTAHHHHVTLTILAAGGSAASFALFDVLVQQWSKAWGIGRFPPTMLAFVALFSCGTIPRFPSPLSRIERSAWPWLLGGSLVLAAQATIFISSVAYFRNATAANVVYSSRGLLSVGLVWLIGHWFGNREQQLGVAVLRQRLIGAMLMLTAIGIVLTFGPANEASVVTRDSYSLAVRICGVSRGKWAIRGMFCDLRLSCIVWGPREPT